MSHTTGVCMCAPMLRILSFQDCIFHLPMANEREIEQSLHARSLLVLTDDASSPGWLLCQSPVIASKRCALSPKWRPLAIEES